MYDASLSVIKWNERHACGLEPGKRGQNIPGTALLTETVVTYEINVTMSKTERKLFQPLKLFKNYFNDIEHVGKYS